MDLSDRLVLKQTTRLSLNQQLVQSIEMLQLSNIELAEKISFELLENPVLEEENITNVPATDFNDINLLSTLGKELSGENEAVQKNEEWNRDTGNTPYEAYDDDRKRSFIENAVAQKESLNEHLINQAGLIAKDMAELSLLELLITSLNDKGFLTIIPEEIAKENSVSITEVMNTLEIIYGMDPIGCGASSVVESLIIQARYLFPEDDILLKILSDHFYDLEKLNYAKISTSLKIPTTEVIKKSRLIHNLDPYPGIKYSLKQSRYILPDIEVKLVDDEIYIGINDDWIPKISINSYYNTLLKKKTLDTKLSGYIKDKLYSAKHLLRSITSRRETIIKVITAIMENQRDFLKKGPGHLKPLVYADIALEIGMHESTISRVSNNKFVQTPWGLYEVKYFFVSKLKLNNLEDHSSEEVMTLIKAIVTGENPLKPYSDSDIWEELRKKGINIARRTIAKYRSNLNISSSNIRKRLNLFKSEEKL